MAIVMGRCSNCSEKVYLDDARERGYCLYCGSPLVVRDAVERLGPVAVSVSTDGAGAEDALIKRGYMEIENMPNHTERRPHVREICDIFEKALNINPDNYLAWKGIFEAILKFHDRPEVREGRKMRGTAPTFRFNAGVFFCTGISRDDKKFDYTINDEYNTKAVKALETAIKVAPADKKAELLEMQEKYVTIPRKQLDLMIEPAGKGLCVYCGGKFKILGPCRDCGKPQGTSPFYGPRVYN